MRDTVLFRLLIGYENKLLDSDFMFKPSRTRPPMLMCTKENNSYEFIASVY